MNTAGLYPSTANLINPFINKKLHTILLYVDSSSVVKKAFVICRKDMQTSVDRGRQDHNPQEQPKKGHCDTASPQIETTALSHQKHGD